MDQKHKDASVFIAIGSVCVMLAVIFNYMLAEHYIDIPTLYHFLFFPLYAGGVIFLKQVIGIKTYGIFIPLIMCYTYTQTNALYGIVSYTCILLLGILFDHQLNKFNLLNASKRSFMLFFLGVSFLFLQLAANILALPIMFLGIPFIIMVHVMDVYNKMVFGKGEKYANLMMLSTLLSSVCLYGLVWLTEPHILMLLTTNILLLFLLMLVVNILLALYTGPRLLEVIRFKQLVNMDRWRTTISGHSFLSMNYRNSQIIKNLNTRESIRLVDDKVEFKDVMKEYDIPTTRLIALISEGDDVEKAAASLVPPFVIKPAHGAAGKGIIIFNEQRGDEYIDAKGISWSFAKLKNHIHDVVSGTFSLTGEGEPDQCMIEEKLVPPQFFLDFSDAGLADVRVIFFLGEPIGAMMRIPTKKSAGKANISQGAKAAHVDIHTGAITAMYDKVSGRLPIPKEEQKILPEWDAVLERGRDAVLACDLVYGGCDIVYDEQLGPILMENNARPGLEIQNVCHLNLKKEIYRVYKEKGFSLELNQRITAGMTQEMQRFMNEQKAAIKERRISRDA